MLQSSDPLLVSTHNNSFNEQDSLAQANNRNAKNEFQINLNGLESNIILDAVVNPTVINASVNNAVVNSLISSSSTHPLNLPGPNSSGSKTFNTILVSPNSKISNINQLSSNVNRISSGANVINLNTNLSTSNTNLSTSNINLSNSNRNLSNSHLNLSNSNTNLSNSNTNLSNSNINVSNSTINLINSNISLLNSNVKLINSSGILHVDASNISQLNSANINRSTSNETNLNNSDNLVNSPSNLLNSNNLQSNFSNISTSQSILSNANTSQPGLSNLNISHSSVSNPSDSNSSLSNINTLHSNSSNLAAKSNVNDPNSQIILSPMLTYTLITDPSNSNQLITPNTLISLNNQSLKNKVYIVEDQEKLALPGITELSNKNSDVKPSNDWYLEADKQTCNELIENVSEFYSTNFLTNDLNIPLDDQQVDLIAMDDHLIRHAEMICSKCKVVLTTGEEIQKHVCPKKKVEIDATDKFLNSGDVMLNKNLSSSSDNSKLIMKASIRNNLPSQDPLANDIFPKGEILTSEGRSASKETNRDPLSDCNTNCKVSLNSSSNPSHFSENSPSDSAVDPLSDNPSSSHQNNGEVVKRTSLRNQQKTTVVNPNTCSECGKIFKKKSDLICHRRKHNVKVPPQKICPYCQRQFKKPSDLVRAK